MLPNSHYILQYEQKNSMNHFIDCPLELIAFEVFFYLLYLIWHIHLIFALFSNTIICFNCIQARIQRLKEISQTD